MRTHIFLLIILSFLFRHSYSQIPVGLKFDCSGYGFHGYFDPLIYNPQNKLSTTHIAESFEDGYYYDKDGKKVKCMIKFEHDQISVKNKKSKYTVVITPEEIKSVVIGVDSFFTIYKYYNQNTLKYKPVFVQFIAQFGGNTFVKLYHFGDVVVSTYLVKASDSDTWVNFSGKNFRQRVWNYFSHIPYLRNKILSGEYDEEEDLLPLIKMAEYLEKYEKQEPVLYDQFWQETHDPERAVYLARITAKKDSVWTFDYFKGAEKLYTANYTSFFPHIKWGEFTAWYPEGNIRQVITYKNDKAEEVKIFGRDNSLLSHFQYIEDKKNKKVITKYLSCADSLSNHVLDGNRQTLTMIDNVDGKKYTQVFCKNELISSYRITNQDTVFQIVNPNEALSFGAFKIEFNTYMKKQTLGSSSAPQGTTYDDALSMNAQGTILVSLLIDKKGYAPEGYRLNSIHPQLDSLVDDFLKKKILPGAKYPFSFSPLRKNGKKSLCELVIPIVFSIDRFYREPVHYYYYYNNFREFNIPKPQIPQIQQRPMNFPTYRF